MAIFLLDFFNVKTLWRYTWFLLNTLKDACSFRGDHKKLDDFFLEIYSLNIWKHFFSFEATRSWCFSTEKKIETELVSRPMDGSCLSIGRTHSTSHRYYEERCWAEKGAKSTENMSGHHLSADKVNNNWIVAGGRTWGGRVNITYPNFATKNSGFFLQI